MALLNTQGELNSPMISRFLSLKINGEDYSYAFESSGV